MHVLEKSATSSRASLRTESFADKAFEGVISSLLGATIQQYVRYPALMRAMEDVSLWPRLLPISKTQLQDRMTRMVVAYLR